MATWLIKKELAAATDRIAWMRADLAILNEQLQQLRDEADYAETTSVVAESPLERAEAADVMRNYEGMKRERDRRQRDLEALLRRRDEMLDRLSEQL